MQKSECTSLMARMIIYCTKIVELPSYLKNAVQWKTVEWGNYIICQIFKYTIFYSHTPHIIIVYFLHVNKTH
jgi:hypothetical protein